MSSSAFILRVYYPDNGLSEYTHAPSCCLTKDKKRGVTGNSILPGMIYIYICTYTHDQHTTPLGSVTIAYIYDTIPRDQVVVLNSRTVQPRRPQTRQDTQGMRRSTYVQGMLVVVCGPFNQNMTENCGCLWPPHSTTRHHRHKAAYTTQQERREQLPLVRYRQNACPG